jgi:tetratricopeptide (TPR) repeat protein
MTADHEPDSSSLYFEGKSAMKAGDLDTAIDLFKQSINLSPHFKTLELLGECLLLRNELPEAIIYLAAAAGLGNNQFRSRFLLSQALLKSREKSNAIEKLKEALAINPNYKAAKKLLDTLFDASDELSKG